VLAFLVTQETISELVIATVTVAVSVLLEYLRRRLRRYLEDNPKANRRGDIVTIVVVGSVGLVILGGIISAYLVN
jgi:CHASE3 domain sensor protein